MNSTIAMSNSTAEKRRSQRRRWCPILSWEGGVAGFISTRCCVYSEKCKSKDAVRISRLPNHRLDIYRSDRRP